MIDRIKKTWMRWKQYEITYWGVYTLAFILVFTLVFAPFLLGGHSFVKRTDGLNQQYVSLLYFRRWLGSVWDTFTATGRWELPLWDLNIGLGDDIFVTISYYIITSAGCIFCPERWLEYYYDLAFIFRLYLAGVTFSLFARWHGKPRCGALLGSLAYCFCGFVIQKGVQHTFFVLPMVFLPLVLLGADKTLKKQSPVLFIIATALCAITNFYFFYMTVIATAMYVLGQLWLSEEKAGLLKRMAWLGKFLLYGMIGIAISGFIFIPTAYAMLGSGRVGAGNDVPALYPVAYYYQLLWGSGTNVLRDYDSRTGFAVPVLAAIFLLWIRKGRKKLKVYFAALFLCLCLPFFGSAFNGFGYVSNRWIYIFSFLVSYILAEMYSDFLRLSLPDAWKLTAVISVYWLAGAAAALVIRAESADFYRNGIYLIAFVVILGCMAYKQCGAKAVQKLLTAVTVASIAVNGYFEFFPSWGGVTSAYVSSGDVLSEYTDKLPSNDLLQIEDIHQYRSDVSHNTGEKENSFMIQQIPGTQFYFSVVQDSVNAFLTEMYYDHPLEHQYNGFQDRLILNSLSGVKYCLTASDDETLASDPAFVRTEYADENRTVYENSYALPLAYLYDTYIPRSYYDGLDVADKQEALAVGAVVESSTLPETGLSFSNYDISYEMRSDNVSITENGFIVDGEDSEIVLELERIPEDAEVYVIMEGMQWQGMDPVTQWAGGDLKNLSWDTRQVIRSGQRMYTQDDNVAIDIAYSGRTGGVTYFTPRHRMYCGRHDFLCNLGYIGRGDGEITLYPQKSGFYTFDRIRVVAQPRKPIEAYLSDRQSKGVNDWRFLVNAMEGSVTCEKDSILCVAVPFSEGWSALVDGIKVPVERVNTVYMGIAIGRGSHTVRFVYATPYGKAGVVCTAAGILVTAGLAVRYAVRKRRGIAN